MKQKQAVADSTAVTTAGRQVTLFKKSKAIWRGIFPRPLWAESAG